MPDAQRAEIAKLEALHAEHPQGRIFTHLAEAYRKAGEYERAREVLAEGIGRHPDYSSAHVVLARVLMDMGDEEQAVAEFQRVLELDAHNLVALRCLGDLARESGHVDEAGRYYRRLLEVEPSDDDVRRLLDRIENPPPAEEVVEADEEPWITGGEADESAAFAEATWDGTVEAPHAIEQPDGQMDEAAPDDAAESGVLTETIAQVYARQGLYDRAAEVYRRLVHARPDDAALRTRLEEMEALAAAPSPGTGDLEVEGPVLEDEGVAFGADAAGQVDSAPDAEPEPEPATATVEGLETMELDAAPDVAPLAGLETDELDPETGLRPVDETPIIEGLPDDRASDVLPPPEEESPWAAMEPAPDLPAEDEPWASSEPAPEEEPWVSGSPEPEAEDEPWAFPGDEQEAEPWGAGLDTGAGPEGEPEDEEARVESVWTGGEGASTQEESPYAWADPEDDAPVDDSEAIGPYLRSLVGWGGGAGAAPAATPSPPEEGRGAEGAGSEPAGGEAAAPDGDAEASGAGGPAADAEPGAGPEGEAAASPEEPKRSSDDDDLDTFRSWLESLKQ